MYSNFNMIIKEFCAHKVFWFKLQNDLFGKEVSCKRMKDREGDKIWIKTVELVGTFSYTFISFTVV